MQTVLRVSLYLLQPAWKTLEQSDRPLRIEQVLFVDRLDICVYEVCGQDQLGFNEREYQAQDHNDRHRREERSDNAADKEHRRKCSNGRQHTECRGNRHLLGSLHDIVDGMSLGLNIRVDTLTDDDRIVDNNTKDDNEAEQADHVDCHWPWSIRHKPQRAEETDRDADDDPASHLHTKEQRQQQEDEYRTHRHIPEHQLEPPLEIV